MNDPHFTTPIAQHIWDTKYRYREHGVALDAFIEDTWQRVDAVTGEILHKPDTEHAAPHCCGLEREPD